MQENIFVRLIPVVSENTDDSVKITIPGTNQSSVITNDEFNTRFGNCIDINTMLSTLKYIYENTNAHAERTKHNLNNLDSLSEEDRISTIREEKVLPIVCEKLRRMKHQIDMLEDIKLKYKQ